MKREAGLPELLDALRWRWKTVAALALLVFAGAAAYVESLPSQYDGKAVVAFGPRPDEISTGSDAVRVVAPKYVAYVLAPSTLDNIARDIGEDPVTLGRVADASIARDTGNVEVTVRLPTPKRAAAAANWIAETMVTRAKDDPLLTSEVAAEASPPRAPAAPPRRLLEAAALGVGLLFGVTTALLLERGRPRLRSWQDIAEATDHPLLGRIPVRRALGDEPTSAFADPVTRSAFRSLRAGVAAQLRVHQLLVVTSPRSGAGKTTVAALLAEALGRTGNRALLVDADLERPHVARLADLGGTRGLSELLRSGQGLNGAVRPGWSEGLSILPTGADSDAGDLVPRGFERIACEARAQYDVVIVDAPALLEAEEGRALAVMADSVLLVVPAGSPEADLKEALRALDTLKTPVLGVVGNRLTRK